ncbi:hypothetical protein GIB67_017506 [Kingdonia uniflora]|uniref:Uncharacterized protein n=1 Tax=Kingdonia uniflora TaxID=39325 RepID=A0A7J7M4I1_9MAGN|nr:hypothetical protein GIB67_017506 [Kingdonia uniflora]
MVVQGEKPSVLSYGALLIALENGKLFVEEHMIKVGVLPNLYAYTIIALVYNKQGNSEMNSASVSDSLNVSNDAVANLKINIEEVFSKHLSNMLSTVDRTREVANKGLTDFSSDLNEATRNIGTVSIDALRWAIVKVEDYLASGTSFIVYYYGYAKDYFPSEARDALNLTEDSTTKFLRPVGYAIKQVYSAIEVLETYLGVDPNDPIVPFFLFVGTTVALGVAVAVAWWVPTCNGNWNRVHYLALTCEYRDKFEAARLEERVT